MIYVSSCTDKAGVCKQSGYKQSVLAHAAELRAIACARLAGPKQSQLSNTVLPAAGEEQITHSTLLLATFGSGTATRALDPPGDAARVLPEM